jgi:GNAT superfamily N-acetyltransferase
VTPSPGAGGPGAAGVRIETVGEGDLADLLPLMRGYSDFYEVDPSDEALLTLSRALIADPQREGVQFLARDDGGAAIGFATVYWLWSTSSASRIGLMNDLFVAPEGRGSGAAEALIERCRQACRDHGATKLTWQTAKDNLRAQKVYDRVGGTREEWFDYWLDA